jgi:SAM-dependent methyltransferase
MTTRHDRGPLARWALLACALSASGCARKEARSARVEAAEPEAAPIEAPAEPEPEVGSTGEELEEPWKPRWQKKPDVVYLPTPQPVVDKMLEMAKVGKNDLIYDLGCGDGRILVTAAKRYGARGYGVDIDPDRIDEARANAKKAGVAHLVTIEEGDIFETDVSEATVVTLYLLPDLNARLLPALRKLGEGARIVTHDYGLEGIDFVSDWMWEPEDPEMRAHFVYLYEAPLGK